MDDVKINTSKTISLALGADPDSNTVNATLSHEFADSSIVQASTACTRTSAGNYTITYGESTANSNNFVTSSTDAPSKTGVEIGIPDDKFIASSSNSLSLRGLIFSS